MGKLASYCHRDINSVTLQPGRRREVKECGHLRVGKREETYSS